MEALVGKRIRSLTVLSPDLAESGSDRSAAPDDGVHTLKRVLDSIRKYKRLVRTIIVVGTLLVAAISLLIPATYLATAQLAVDVRQSGASECCRPFRRRFGGRRRVHHRYPCYRTAFGCISSATSPNI